MTETLIALSKLCFCLLVMAVVILAAAKSIP
jgi:hypothetical protein